jgi:hypothetical protein
VNNQKKPLTLLIESMISAALNNPHRPVKRSLKSGLYMTMTASSLGIDLFLHREGTFPSDTEIKTILKYWPYFTGDVPVTKIHLGEKPGLRLSIKTPTQT